MQQFSIKQVERLTGIKAHTIRIWEKRYSMVVPSRKEGNHRLYSNEDLKVILRIVYLNRNGHKISKIAGLSPDELIGKIKPGKVNDHYNQAVLLQLMEACIDFDEENFNSIFAEAELRNGFEKTILQVIYPFFETLGLAWVTSRILPAQEHFISQLIFNKIIIAIDELFSSETRGKNCVLLFQPNGEHHEIPLLFINYLLKKNGCRTIYFGSNVSIPQIEYYCSTHPVTHIHYHLITNFTDMDADDYLSDLCTTFPTKTIVGSGAFASTISKKNPNALLLKSGDEIMAYIREIGDNG